VFRIPLLNALTGNLKNRIFKSLEFSCFIYVAVFYFIYIYIYIYISISFQDNSISARILILTLMSN